MDNITLKQLRYFEAVAQQGHFGRAADICSISQPAISVQIKELEQSLETDLFQRSAKPIRLTPFGEEFARHVRKILRSVDDLASLARTAKDGMVGKLRLGVLPTIAPYYIPQAIKALTRAEPDLDLYIRENRTDTLLRDLHDGSLDLAIIALPVSEPDLLEVELFQEPFILVRPQNQAAEPVPAPHRLPDHQLLLLEEGHCFRDQALAFCNIPSRQAHNGLEGSSLATLVQLVGAGLGVTLIPEMAMNIEGQYANVALARFSDPEPCRHIGLVWRKNNPLHAQFTQLADTLRTITPAPTTGRVGGAMA